MPEGGNEGKLANYIFLWCLPSIVYQRARHRNNNQPGPVLLGLKLPGLKRQKKRKKKVAFSRGPYYRVIYAPKTMLRPVRNRYPQPWLGRFPKYMVIAKKKKETKRKRKIAFTRGPYYRDIFAPKTMLQPVWNRYPQPWQNGNRNTWLPT